MWASSLCPIRSQPFPAVFLIIAVLRSSKNSARKTKKQNHTRIFHPVWFCCYLFHTGTTQEALVPVTPFTIQALPIVVPVHANQDLHRAHQNSQLLSSFLHFKSRKCLCQALLPLFIFFVCLLPEHSSAKKGCKPDSQKRNRQKRRHKI